MTVSECDEIEAIVARMMADDRRRETEHSASLDARPSERVDACQRRMTRAGRLLEAANNAENAAKRMKDAALAEFADARRQLETAQASNKSKKLLPRRTGAEKL